MKNKATSPSSAGPSSSSSTSAGLARPPAPPTRVLTHDEISGRARSVWESEGRPWGRDDEFWHRAERELRQLDERRFAKPDSLLDPAGDPNDEVDQRLNELARPRTDRSATSL